MPIHSQCTRDVRLGKQISASGKFSLNISYNFEWFSRESSWNRTKRSFALDVNSLYTIVSIHRWWKQQKKRRPLQWTLTVWSHKHSLMKATVDELERTGTKLKPKNKISQRKEKTGANEYRPTMASTQSMKSLTGNGGEICISRFQTTFRENGSTFTLPFGKFSCLLPTSAESNI